MNPANELMRMANAYRLSQAIYVAADLRLSDHLAAGPLSSADLASAAGCDDRALYRLMRALCSAGVYEEGPDGRFAATAIGEELRSGSERGLGDWTRFVGRPDVWRTWGALGHSIRTGENAFRAVHGVSAWEYRRENPAEGVYFNDAMTAISRHVADAVLSAYTFEGLIVDVGGGHGALLSAILRRFPQTRGVLFDQPHVVAGADLAEVADRCEVVGGDMFEGVPGGGDLYVLKSIVHDWPDERATAILRACRQVMKPGARIAIVERVMPEPPHTAAGLGSALSDLNMLVAPGGQERTRNEYAALLAAAGLTLDQVIETGIEFKLILGS